MKILLSLVMCLISFNANAVIYAIGDSITKGTGITNPYPNTISAWTGIPKVNLGIGGTQLAEQFKNIYSIQPQVNDKVILLTGFNDVRYFGSNSVYWLQSVNASLAWLGTSSRQTAQSLPRTGTWNNVASVVNPIGMWSTSVNSTLTANVTGSTIYIGTLKQLSQAGSFSVTVDGIEAGTFQTSGSTTYQSGIDYNPFLIHLTGYSNSSHTVVVKVLSGRVYVDWVGSPTQGASVYVGSVLKMPESTYPLYPPFNNGSSSIANIYTSAIFNASDNYIADGLSIYKTILSYNQNTQCGIDGIHPNENGQATIAISLLKAMGY